MHKSQETLKKLRRTIHIIIYKCDANGCSFLTLQLVTAEGGNSVMKCMRILDILLSASESVAAGITSTSSCQPCVKSIRKASVFLQQRCPNVAPHSDTSAGDQLQGQRSINRNRNNKKKRTNDSEWQPHANATLYAPLTAATDDDPLPILSLKHVSTSR